MAGWNITNTVSNKEEWPLMFCKAEVDGSPGNGELRAFQPFAGNT